MRWTIKGADKETGADRLVVVEAADQAAANATGNAQGILVESVRVSASWIKLDTPRIAIMLSALAILLSVFTLLRTPTVPGKGLSAYDFSTPEKALVAEFEMADAADVRARIELDVVRANAGHEKARKAIQSLKVDRVVEYGGNSVVFYGVTENGLDYHKVEWFKKGDDGRFFKTFVSTYAWENEADPERSRIGKMIEVWEAKDHPTTTAPPSAPN